MRGTWFHSDGRNSNKDVNLLNKVIWYFSFVPDYVHKPRTRNVSIFIFTYMKCAAGNWIHTCIQLTNFLSDWKNFLSGYVFVFGQKQAQR